MSVLNTRFVFHTDVQNKKVAIKQLNVFKRANPAITYIKASTFSKPAENSGDYTIRGYASIDILVAASSFFKRGTNKIYNNRFEVGVSDTAMNEFIAAEKLVREAEKAEEKKQVNELKKKYANELADLPKGTLFMYEHGECRGSDFQEEKTVSLATFKKKIFTSIGFDEFLESQAEIFHNIFYNIGIREKTWREAMVLILNRLLKGKSILTSWEEGTTGISINKKKLDKKVDKWEGKARMQNPPTDTLLKVLPDKYLKNK